MTDSNVPVGGECGRKISEYLAEHEPGVALLVSGSWGAGKTHFLTRYGEALAKSSERAYLSFSVAGLTTRDELERSLLVAAVPYLGSGYLKAFGPIANAAMRWIKVDPKEISPEADISKGKCLIVLDDLERFAGDQRVLFGFCIDMLDKHRAHLILVASEDKLLLSQENLEQSEGSVFSIWREKLVGATVRLAPAAAEIVNTLLNEMADRATAEKLERHRDLLEAIVRAWGRENFRAARHALRELERTIRQFGAEFDRLGERAAVLITGVLVAKLELQTEPLRLAYMKNIFAQADIGLAEILSESEKESTPAGKYFADITRKYASVPLNLFPGSPSFAEYLETGNINVRLLVEDLAPLEITQGSVRTGREALLSDYYSLSDADFSKEVGSLISDLQSKTIRSPGVIANAYLALSLFQRQGLIQGVSAEDLAELATEAVRDLSEQEFGDASGEIFWHTDVERDEHIRGVVAAFNQKRSEVLKSRVADERQEFFRNIGEMIEDDNLQENWLLRPLFVLDERVMESAIRSLRSDQLQELIRLFGRRAGVQGVAEYLREEKEPLARLAILLSNDGRDEGMSLSKVQLGRVGEAMRRFSEML